MAKTMARIKDNVVVNLEWIGDNAVETVELRNTHGLLVQVGDVYDNGKFYRNGVKLLTFREQLRKNIADYDTALTDIANAVYVPMTIAEGVTPSIEERKQAILLSIANLNYALEMMNKGGL